MAEEKKKKSLYEITGDLVGLHDLMESLVDEDGNPREPTEDEMKQLSEWFNVSHEEFVNKFDSYCKFIKNLKIQSENVTAEKDNYKAEITRLQKRAKAFENKAKNITGLLQICMQNLKMEKFKSDLFSVYMQDNQISINALDGSRLKEVPEDFLKPRELDTEKIKDALKTGKLALGADLFPDDPLAKSKIYFADSKQVLKDVLWTRGSHLVIR